MELVYLWVDGYKNIQKQGFNFSPRFRCEYDEEKNELIINENKDYISIFPENVNITAIVGENGSGKSSVMEFLLEIFALESSKSCLLLYIYENKPRYYSCKISPLNINKLKINGFELEEQSDLLNTNNNDYGHENLISLYINNEYTNNDSIVSPQFFIESSKKSLRAINSLIIENSLKLKDITTKIENYFIPTKINIKLKEIDFFTSILDKDREFYKNDVWVRISEINKQLKDTTLAKKIELVRKIFEIKRDEYDIVMEEPFLVFGKHKTKDYFKFEYRDFGNNIPTKINENTTIGKVHTLNITDIDEEVLNFLYDLPKEFDIEVEDEKRKFSKLSFGERQLLILMNNILKYLLLKKYATFDYDQEGEEQEQSHDINEIVLFIDEFEIGLHPNWQKRFLSYFSEISRFSTKKIHLIMTSHSPFILSDLPKENVIFLENGEQKYPFENGQTFGANIHTLLSHGFFMKDGLMGEFSKDKIDTVIKYLNQIKLSDEEISYCENIISIIGEPIIKRELQRKLDSKKLSKLDKIDEIEEQMRFLEHRLEIIMKNQK